MTYAKVKSLKIRKYKQIEMLDALRATRVTLAFKLSMHFLSIFSTTVYLQGVIAVSVNAVFANYHVHISNMQMLMIFSLLLAGTGSTVLEMSTIEAGSRLATLIKEYFAARRDRDISGAISDMWRVKTIQNKILFFLPIAFAIILLQIFTFSSGAVNTSKLFTPPLSIENEMAQTRRDIAFSMNRIERAREAIDTVESKNFKITERDLGEYSREEEIKKIDKMYADKLAAANREVEEAKKRYRRYLEIENAKRSNFKNGVLLPAAKRLYAIKKEEILSPALSHLESLKELIDSSKRNVKGRLTRSEYIDHILKNKYAIIEAETKNLEKYKLEQQALESRVREQKKRIERGIDYKKYLVAGFLVVLLQIAIEIWFKMERDLYADLVDRNIRNSRRNEMKSIEEELKIPETELVIPDTGIEHIEKRESTVGPSSRVEELKESFPELFNMCLENFREGKPVPTKNEMVSHIYSASTVNRFRRRANGVIYRVDSANGNATEWTEAFTRFANDTAMQQETR